MDYWNCQVLAKAAWVQNKKKSLNMHISKSVGVGHRRTNPFGDLTKIVRLKKFGSIWSWRHHRHYSSTCLLEPKKRIVGNRCQVQNNSNGVNIYLYILWCRVYVCSSGLRWLQAHIYTYVKIIKNRYDVELHLFSPRNTLHTLPPNQESPLLHPNKENPQAYGMKLSVSVGDNLSEINLLFYNELLGWIAECG